MLPGPHQGPEVCLPSDTPCLPDHSPGLRQAYCSPGPASCWLGTFGKSLPLQASCPSSVRWAQGCRRPWGLLLSCLTHSHSVWGHTQAELRVGGGTKEHRPHLPPSPFSSAPF